MSVGFSPQLRTLVAACEPYWGAEAEVVRTYWDWPARTAESDRAWVLRQMHKELWDGFHRPFARLCDNFERLERGFDRREALELAKLMQDELAHYVGFAEVYEALGGAGEPLDPQTLARVGSWAENDELMRLRNEHTRERVDLGRRAGYFTEGGYCTLYSEGTKLEGRGGIDDLIARACSRVFADEFDHMLIGIAGIDDDPPSAADWSVITDMTLAQLRARILMRNAQFGAPVPQGRLAELLAGGGNRLSFDYERAQARATR